ncbi:MAG: TRAP transporter TatT component family protein [Gammaproteobacteria bacterium]|nr:TRAP transporter TatT component family protein [Gammaproteobacteria bacterium]
MTGCSVDQMVVRTSIPMIEGGVEALNHETDLELAEESIPANLNMLMGMINIDPENTQLHTFAAQAYYGLAYGFNEDYRPERASVFYLRGRQHGLQALEISGASNLLDSTIADFDKQVSEMGKDDVAAMFWAASCWAKWIDLHRNDPEAIAQLARATALMQRVIELEDTFYYGGAHMYFGVYYGSRAPLLGGNFEKSRQHFDRARKITGSRLLIPDLLQAQYLARQQQDRQDFHNRLTKIVNAPDDLMPELGLQNEIAKRKARLLLTKESEWF